ncbi:proteasome subunit beta type-3, partial [Parus major]|uniref:proteasome subunit beta type-3 n=1 Tax=Parus major TaxID=9157 RepID=UPI0014446D09
MKRKRRGKLLCFSPCCDVSCRAQRLKFRLNLYELKEGRQIKPQTFMSMVSNLLYERRFGPYYTEPVIAGLDPLSHEPFICSLDLIGCPMVTDDFVVSGTCSEQMYGMCESLWEPDMVSGAGIPWDLPGISWDPLGPSWDLLGSPGTFLGSPLGFPWDPLGPSWDLLGSPGTFWDLLESPGFPQDLPWDSPKIPWDLLGSPGI